MSPPYTSFLPGRALECFPGKLRCTERKVWLLFSDRMTKSTSSSWTAGSPKSPDQQPQPQSRLPYRGTGDPPEHLGLWIPSPEPILKLSSYQQDCKGIFQNTLGHSEILPWALNYLLSWAMGGEGSFIFLTNRGNPHTSLGGITTKHQLSLDTIPTFHTDLSDEDIKPVTSR